LEIKRLQPDDLKKLTRPDITTYIETGTFWGYQLRFASEVFERVIGIEIDEECVERSREWNADRPNVEVIHGDTLEVLPRLASDIKSPCFFYLDAHYCDHPDQDLTPTPFPLWAELRSVRNRMMPDIVFVDDVHEFGKGYPGAEEWSSVTTATIAKFFNEPRWDIIKDGMVLFL
jgi:hypothetical protein